MSLRTRPQTRRRLAFAITETLESRRLMSSELPRDVMDILHQDLWDVAYDVSRGNRNELVDSGDARVDGEGLIQAVFFVDGASEGTERQEKLVRLIPQLRALGAEISEEDMDKNGLSDDINLFEGTLQTWVPALQVDEAARLGGVAEEALPSYAVTNVVSDGDITLKTSNVRAQFPGITGTGIKIGVISDGANNAASVAAELGTYTINPSLPGSGNEGTAMMEIVHDLAPGAQLYFSGPGTNTDMVNSITYLKNQGCTVIVDDLSFLNEGFFTDTSIALAAQQAVTDGVVYVTSAGNMSDHRHWQGNYVASNSTGYQPGATFAAFTGNISNNEVVIPNGVTLRAFLQWSDAWGASANDYNLYLSEISPDFNILKQAKINQTGSQNPYESFSYTNNTGGTITAVINIERESGAAARELELFTFANSAGATLQYHTQGDALFSQEAVTSVMSVAAQNDTAANSNTNSVASYSSRGPSTIYSNFTTQTKAPRQSLDGTAIDGVHTAIGPGAWMNDPFYGTSAAAPHAAAIAGLLRQINPSLTPAQVVQIMADTAIDITGSGGAAGYDVHSGAGLYNALDAGFKAYTPAAVDLTAASDLGASSTDNITKDNTPTLTGTVPSGSFVTLYVDDIANQTVQLGAGVSTYNLTTSAITSAVHAISIKVASSNTVAASNFSFESPVLNVTIDTVLPAAPTTPDLIAADDSGTSSTDNITNKPQPTFSLTSEANVTVQLFANALPVGSLAGSGAFNVAPTNPLVDGSYSITAQATDLAGNTGALSSALNPVKIDATKPVIQPITFDPNQSKMTLSIPFSEDVSAGLGDGTLSVQSINTSTLLLPAVQKYTWDAATKTAKYVFQSLPTTPNHMLADGDWNASMFAANVSDVAGNHPLANGALDFFFFDADANFDRTVNALDFNAIATNFGLPNKKYNEGDYNYDGSVNGLDFTVLAMKFNTTLPLPAPVVPDLVVEPQVANGVAPVPFGSVFADGETIDRVLTDILV